jgi:hypothetical protein
MSLVTMRPTFRLRLQGSFAEVQAKLETALRSPTWRDGSQCFGDYCEFHVPEDQQRYWSPHMAVHLEPLDEQDRIVYRGVLPTPGVEWQDGESRAADTHGALAASVAGRGDHAPGGAVRASARSLDVGVYRLPRSCVYGFLFRRVPGRATLAGGSAAGSDRDRTLAGRHRGLALGQSDGAKLE